MLLLADRHAAGAIALGWLVLIVVLVLYFLPTAIAAIRHVPNLGSVAVVDVFLGWTFIGWVVALAMACRTAPTPTVVNVNQATQPAVAPPPGWYQQPDGRSHYWDGTRWSG